jgi:hypothetical protein
MAKRKKRWIQRAVKHPGAESRAAARHGLSKRAEAEREKRSSDPSIRARGNLALRFMKGGDIHRKGKRKLKRHARRMRRR